MSLITIKGRDFLTGNLAQSDKHKLLLVIWPEGACVAHWKTASRMLFVPMRDLARRADLEEDIFGLSMNGKGGRKGIFGTLDLGVFITAAIATPGLSGMVDILKKAVHPGHPTTGSHSIVKAIEKMVTKCEQAGKVNRTVRNRSLRGVRSEC